MKGKILGVVVLSTLVASYGFLGCELSESCDPATDDNCEVADTGTTDTGGNEDTGSTQTYHYVMVEDLEDPGTSSPTHTAGVDIFGVQLIEGGRTHNASQVHEVRFGTGDNSNATDANQVLGVPDDDCDPSADTPSYVSLGGDGGYLIVSFGSLEEIVEGDDIVVHECGRAQNPGATDEHYDFFVGVATGASDPNWVTVCTRSTGVQTCRVPSLPQVPAN